MTFLESAVAAAARARPNSRTVSLRIRRLWHGLRQNTPYVKLLAMQPKNAITRRSLLHGGALGLATARYLSANPLGMPIGCQTFPVRETIGTDFEGTLKDLAGMGFE